MPCLTENELVELAEARLGSVDRERALAHLDDCPACCDLLGFAAGSTPPGDRTRRFGRYQLVELIGSGTFGSVFRAHDPSLSRDVALKLLHTHGDAAADQRLLAEAHVLARLAHRNVVTIHDVGTEGGQLFLAMELGGTSLRQWVAETPRGWREVLPLMRQAGEGLAAAHATGLVHRDVKPDNILIAQDGRALVTDFGLARVQGEGEPIPDDAPIGMATMTATGRLVGTPAYMAPEQLRGGLADARSDQFAFAATLFEALTGQRPFEATTLAELRAAIDAQKLSPAAARLPRWLRAVVLRGLRVAPDERWPSLRHMLDALAAGPPLARTGVRLALVAGVALLLLVASLVWGIVETSRQRARAERRFAEVRKLATSFLFEFDGAIRNLGGATGARKLVVQRAQEHLDALYAESSGDDDLARELATAYERLAEIQAGGEVSLGDTPGSERSVHQALAIRERLAATFRDDDRAALAATLLDAAHLHPMEPAALEQARRALALRKELATANPGDARRQRGLATAHLRVGDLVAMRGDYAGGIPHKRRAYEIYEALAAASPDDDNAQRSAALGAKYLGALLQKTGDRGESRRLYERAIAVDRARVARRPHDANAKLDLSYSEASLANLQAGEGELDASLAGYGRALALREAVAAADPLNRIALARVARAHAAIAGVLGQKGDLGSELASEIRALAIYEALFAADLADVGLAASVAEVNMNTAWTAIQLAIAARRRGADPRPLLAAARAWGERAVTLAEAHRGQLDSQQLETLIIAVGTRAMAGNLTAAFATRSP